MDVMEKRDDKEAFDRAVARQRRFVAALLECAQNARYWLALLPRDVLQTVLLPLILGRRAREWELTGSMEDGSLGCAVQ